MLKQQPWKVKRNRKKIFLNEILKYSKGLSIKVVVPKAVVFTAIVFVLNYYTVRT